MENISIDAVNAVLLKSELSFGLLTPSEVELLAHYIAHLERENEKLTAKLGRIEDELQSAEAELEVRPATRSNADYDDL